MPINTLSDFDAIAGQNLPARLKERERFVFAPCFETGTLPRLTFGSRFKHCLVALVYSHNNVLNGLAWQLFPMGEPRQPFQFTDMVDQSKLTDILTIDTVISTLESNTIDIFPK